MNHPRLLMVGWLIDGTGQKTRRHMCIGIRNGWIDFVRPCDPALTAKGTEEIQDWSNATVLPAWIDCHVHLAMSGTTNPEERTAQLSDEDPERIHRIERHLTDHRRWGIVAVRDGGDRHQSVLQYCRNLAARGIRLPVHVATPGAAWHARGRYGQVIGRSPAAGKTLAEAIESNWNDCPYKPDHLKIVQSGLNSLTHFAHQTAPQFSFSELREAVSLAHRLGLPVMAHANGILPVSIAADVGCTSIEHGFFMGEEVLKRLAELGTVWVPTVGTMKAYAESLPSDSAQISVAQKTLDHQLNQLYDARRFGVRIAMGTDSGSMGVHHGRSFLEEFRLFLEAGHAVHEAAAAASRNGAELIGLGHLGTIEVGKAAVFLRIPGPPETIAEQLVHVVLEDFRQPAIDDDPSSGDKNR
ncbi:MAG: amidohydrolase family protein [Thermodesulfobacteriota bacterium]